MTVVSYKIYIVRGDFQPPGSSLGGSQEKPGPSTTSPKLNKKRQQILVVVVSASEIQSHQSCAYNAIHYIHDKMTVLTSFIQIKVWTITQACLVLNDVDVL